MGKSLQSSKSINTLQQVLGKAGGIGVFTKEGINTGKLYTGHWVVAKKRHIGLIEKQVVVYDRSQRGVNKIFIGKITNIKMSPSVIHRWLVCVQSWTELGQTHLNWHQFAGGSNPVRYV